MTDIQYKKVTIASGQTSTDAIDLEGGQLCGIFVPSTFDGTSLALWASQKIDGTYVAVQAALDASTAFSITTTASRYIPLTNLAVIAALEYIKLVAGSSQSSTDTELTLVLRNV